MPEEFGGLIKGIKDKVRNINKAIISVHCHNDLGLAVANALAAVRNGAEQVECTVNGIGERAGNCSMEEVVMALRTRKDFYSAETRVRTEEITRSSRLVTKITGIQVQPNKAIVGANAFAHESGIHQDGLLKERSTYEIMTPESVGLLKTHLVLGKHSGRHAFRDRLKDMGYELSDEDLNKAFERFKRIADQKKEVFDEDLEAIVSDEMQQIEEIYVLKSLSAQSGTGMTPTATVEMLVEGKPGKQTGTGDGPVDAVYRTIASMTGTKSKLDAYLVKGITGGTDALGEVTVKVEEAGKKVAGHGADTDIIIASAKAYVNALNKLEYWKKGRTKNS
jgi:2-isopropylmalate synthase